MPKAPPIPQGFTAPRMDTVLANYGGLSSEVQQFLARHPFLVPLLIEAIGHLRIVFGRATADLEVDRDPDGGSEELFAVVRVNMDPEGAVELLHKFDQEWFDKASRRARGLLNFTVRTDDTR